MKATQGQVANVPQAYIGLNDARVLLTMVTTYLLYLCKAVPPSPKQKTQLCVLRGMQQRLSALLASPQQAEETPIWLTQQEIQALYEALSGFARLMRIIIPASTLRDETIRDIERFRETLKMMLSPTKS